MGLFDNAKVTVLLQVELEDGTAASFELGNLRHPQHNGSIIDAIHRAVSLSVPGAVTVTPVPVAQMVKRHLYHVFTDPLKPPTQKEVLDLDPTLNRLNSAIGMLRRIGLSYIAMSNLVNSDEAYIAAKFSKVSPSGLSGACNARFKVNVAWNKDLAGWNVSALHDSKKAVLIADLLENLLARLNATPKGAVTNGS